MATPAAGPATGPDPQQPKGAAHRVTKAVARQQTTEQAAGCPGIAQVGSQQKRKCITIVQRTGRNAATIQHARHRRYRIIPRRTACARAKVSMGMCCGNISARRMQGRNKVCPNQYSSGVWFFHGTHPGGVGRQRTVANRNKEQRPQCAACCVITRSFFVGVGRNVGRWRNSVCPSQIHQACAACKRLPGSSSGEGGNTV